MKTLFIFSIVVLFSSFSPVVNATDPNSELGLYTKEEFVLQPVENITEILERFERETPEKNITLYIHGRGRHIDQEWKLLTKMEKDYGTRVVMFHWPSWKSLLERPVENAKNSADELASVFHLIKQFKDEHPYSFNKKKFSLLVHSMGHVILREHAEKFNLHDLNSADGNPLFDNLVSAGADIGMMDHRQWLSSIDYIKKKYIMMNNRDLMLMLSYMLDLKANKPYYYKLGLGFERIPLKKEKIFKMIDSDTTYIDLSRSLKTDHRYFESTKPLMMRIFKPMVNGESFAPESLGDGLGARIKKEQNIYYVID